MNNLNHNNTAPVLGEWALNEIVDSVESDFKEYFRAGSTSLPCPISKDEIARIRTQLFTQFNS